MNIFFLDRDYKKAAEYHCDKHIVKMATEYTQMLSTTIHITNSVVNDWVYAPAYEHHPCTLWTSESLTHWSWLWKLAHYVGNEYTKRYNKIHKATRVLRNLPIPTNLITQGWLRDPPQAMPDVYKCDDTVQAYRTYYLKDKAKFAKWEKCTPPPLWWIVE